jgi:hypothetical protein
MLQLMQLVNYYKVTKINHPRDNEVMAKHKEAPKKKKKAKHEAKESKHDEKHEVYKEMKKHAR